MKRFAAFAFVAIFASAHLSFAEDETPQNQQQRVRRHVGNGSGQAARNAEISRRVTSQPNFQRKFNTGPQTNFRAQQSQRATTINPNINRQLNVNRTPRVYNPANAQNNFGYPDARVGSSHNWRGNAGYGNANNGNVNNGNGNSNWKNRRGDHSRWSNFRNFERSRHDRGWWRNRYTRFALFGGGYYYYNSGFWYPAYGYDPYFTNYSYDAPIYAYNDQEPGQVIANVQSELSQRGYNPGAVDGTYGPATRNALLNFQADSGLPESGEIDEATLDALGLQ